MQGEYKEREGSKEKIKKERDARRKLRKRGMQGEYKEREGGKEKIKKERDARRI